MDMLRELSDLDRHSRWSETKRRVDTDPRYKVIDSSSRREDWFREYVKSLGGDEVSTELVLTKDGGPGGSRAPVRVASNLDVRKRQDY